MAGLQVLGRTYRHLNRYRAVAAVLVKHGFGDLVKVLGLDTLIEAGLRGFMRHPPPLELAARPQRVLLALQELGPTFVKAGQYLSTRADLLPTPYLRELAKLQDDVPPFPAEDARRIIEEDLGRPASELFARFDGRPLAAASIAQIHGARLLDGREVVVKVERPDIRRVTAIDLEIMEHLAGIAENHSAEWRKRRPTLVIAEIARSLDREMDFALEAAHTERFARQFLDEPTVRVPAVHRDLSSARVLTLERVGGLKADNVRALERAGLDPRIVAENMANHYMAMIFVHGFFHADPHPGNLFIQPDHVVAYVDFGMTGRLDRDTRESLADVIYAVSRRDDGLLTSALLSLAEYDSEPDEREFRSDMAELMDQYAYRPLGEWRLGRMLEQLFQTTARHGVRIPADLFLMVKALTELESFSRNLDPAFDVIGASEPYVRMVHDAKTSPARVAERLAEAGRRSLDLLESAPSELREILRQARRGRLVVEFEHKGLEPVLNEVDQASNRLAYAILLAALVIGSALLVHARVPPFWRELPVLGLGGFLLSAFMALLLLAAIVRHGRL